MKKPEILIVDDEPINLSVLRNLLCPFFLVRACKSGEESLRLISSGPKPDLILLDILMPGLDGYDTLSRIRENPDNYEIPVIYITALDSIAEEEKGFSLGAVDYITKPFRAPVVLERIRVHLELKQSRDLLKDKNDWLQAEVDRRVKENRIIHDLALNMITQLVETRDTDTANHITRTKTYIEILAGHLRKMDKYRAFLTDERLDNIISASALHDIGKIGIPDSILLKPGRLTAEEFELMKAHCKIGGDAIRSAMEQVPYTDIKEDSDSAPASYVFFAEAQKIATSHHERWDGSGYPDGLKGDEIPLPALLMALADVFDALTTVRIYKRAWSMEDAYEHIVSERGKHFSPDIVDAFMAERAAFEHTLVSMSSDEERGDLRDDA